MDYSLSPEQQELQAAFRRFFDQYSTTTQVRAAEALGFSDDLWKRLSDLGVPAMAVDDGDGQVASLSELVVIAEEYGRHLAPVPLVESLTATRAIGRAGTDGADGADGRAELVTFSPRVLPAGGEVWLLPAGAVAGRVVALAGADLVLAGFTDQAPLKATKNLGASPLAMRTLGSDRTVLAAGADAGPAFERSLDDWKVLTAAALVGLAERGHEIAVAYVKERKAFGVPIGWFQTVAHRLADHINDLDGARFLVHKAAWAIDSDDDRARVQVSMAYAYTCALAERVTADCLHFHGGIGYTLEHDIQLFFRRAKAWPLALGDPRREYQVLADRMFGPRRVA
jgi:alkylation response protein AidB-like acyl-CoA dehydrogenase